MTDDVVATIMVPKLGPEPVLLSRKEVDVLYEILDAVRTALATLQSTTGVAIEYIVTGGSLLGAIRQHSILFCDDDIDIAILMLSTGENDNDDTNKTNVYEDIVVPYLQQTLGPDYIYQTRPWEGGDRIRSQRMNTIFLDLFVIRQYKSVEELRAVIAVKKNGQPQSEAYVQGILDRLQAALHEKATDQQQKDEHQRPLFPLWHFSTRKAIEMWVKEVYKDWELFPLQRNLKFGPLTGIHGPHMPVTLLKRAFGDDCFDVYCQSASHKESKITGTTTTETPINGASTVSTTHDLPPRVQTGGTWKGGQKAPLNDEHYLPMQPIARARRRSTLHCKQRLMDYLKEQSAREETCASEAQLKQESFSSAKKTHATPEESCLSSRPHGTVYLDGVFDLFHIGHLEAIRQCAKLGNRIIIGVTGDEDATRYKRRPIVPQAERVAIVQALSMVDRVICPCPLIVTEQFMNELGIDLVAHGFANDADAELQKEFFEIPMQLGKFQRISYYRGLSTTDRIHHLYRIMDEKDTALTSAKGHCQDASAKPQWFGASLADATGNSATIPTDPFPVLLRQVIEPHIEKARVNRREALDAIQSATGERLYDEIMNKFRRKLATETDFHIDKSERNLLLVALFQSTSLPVDTDLSRIHEWQHARSKDRLLQALTQNPVPFQQAYDEFVCRVCAPRFSSLIGESCKEVYYQSFPCLRIVQPDEFSIGPHADVAYGHHPCSINFYVPLTQIGGASSLFLESRPGAEDWHSLEGDLGDAKHFAGAICMHWTTDNKTSLTRVSLDFRLLEGSMYEAFKCGGDQRGGKIDVYRKSPGYYSKCVKHVLEEDGSVVWKRTSPRSLAPPDYRVGFPWTVRSWEKFWSKAS